MREIYSRARKNKDRNFDGTFFFAVKTTGIFCRPSCPAPVAKEENVEYYTSIFEALEAGFRPCMRCRPDVAVDYYNGNPNGTMLVQAALHKIYDGYLHYHSISDLAEEFDISERHLRKLFVDNLGVPPSNIDRYHKTLFAKKLLLCSTQSITDVAFAAGFGSLRQFNDVFKKTYGKTPTDVRKEAALKRNGKKTGTPPTVRSQQDTTAKCSTAVTFDASVHNPVTCPERGSTTLLLSYTPPFNFSQLLDFMRLRAISGVEIITKTSYSRTFRTEQASGYFTVTDNPPRSALELQIHCDDIRCYMPVYNKVRRLFDLDTNFNAINQQFGNDPLLASGMQDGHVPRLPVAFDPFEFVIRAILGQQISVKAATTLAGRIAHKAGQTTPDIFPEGLDYFFPTPDELDVLDLSELGLTQARIATIQTVTKAVLGKRLSLSPQQTMGDFRQEFSALKGIGEWTVQYVAMRGLGMKDAFPASDLGVIKALTTSDTAPSPKDIKAMAEQWKPFRTYATLCLWNQPIK